jgi:hypothetical protein
MLDREYEYALPLRIVFVLEERGYGERLSMRCDYSTTKPCGYPTALLTKWSRMKPKKRANGVL